MKEFNFFDITGNVPDLNGQNVHIADLVSQGDISKLEKGLSRYKGLHTLNKGTSKELVRIFTSSLGIELTDDFLKKLPTISFQTRKIMKDTKKELVEIIDSPEFLPSYLYLLLGFSISDRISISSNSQNSIRNFAGTIIQLLSNSTVTTETYFCAHRENKKIKKNSLVEQINEKDFYRVKNLLHGIVSNLPNVGKYNLNFYAIQGNLTGSINVFPNILFSHFLSGELYKIPLTLDKQFEHMNGLVNKQNEKLFSTDEMDKIILQIKDQISDSDEDFIKKEVLPHFDRFKQEIQKFKQLDNLKQLIELNLQNAERFGKRKLVENMIDKILKFDILEKSIEEYLFYFNWGKKIAESGNVAFGFDRDHEKYQTLTFERGFNGNLPPILYARRTGKKSGNQVNELSFRQFWHYYD